MSRQRVKLDIGYSGEETPVSFSGEHFGSASNQDTGRNSVRFHELEVYGVSGGVRVYDKYHSERGINRSLTEVISPAEALAIHPQLYAVLAQHFSRDELALDLDAGHSVPKTGQR